MLQLLLAELPLKQAVALAASISGATICNFTFKAIANRKQLGLIDDIFAAVLEMVFMDMGLI